jgi:UDP-glucose:(heptosyl)LPS alpha-1,3-glucosyltransferase
MGALARLGLRFNLHHRYLCRAEDRLFTDSRLRAVICNSMMVRDEVRSAYPAIKDKLHVIYNGVDLDRFSPHLQEGYRDLMRERLGLAATQPVLLFMGSGFARKGLRYVLHALALGDAKIHLVVAGSDKHAHRYKALAARLRVSARCHFIGPVDDPRPYYGMADALVLPSIYDPFPNAALEALASGLPIIVSTGCGASEVVKEGSNGWVTPVGDSQALATALSAWQLAHADRLKATALKQSARTLAEGFGATAMGQKLLELYQNLLANRAA